MKIVISEYYSLNYLEFGYNENQNKLINYVKN